MVSGAALARIATVFFAVGFLEACQVDLYTNLAEREANSMVARLLNGGVPARRVLQPDGQMTIVVDEAYFAQSVQILEDAGLPKTQFASMGKIFERDGLVASPLQERAQMIYALSEELSRTVSEIDGVLSARVHVVLPDNDPVRRDVAPSSASVFIRHEPSLDINPLIPQIKTLVANGIAGLSYEKVSVVPVAAPARAAEPAAPPQDIASLFGVQMLDSSVARASWIVGILGFLVIALGGTLAAIFLRQRRRGGAYELATVK